MKARMLSDLPKQPFSQPGVFVTCVVKATDEAGFTTYELHVPSGTKITLKAGDLDLDVASGSNHVYYCLQGQSEAQVSADHVIQFEAGTVIAMTSAMSVTLTATSALRVAVTYVAPSTTEKAPTEPLVRKLSDLIGTERDVDWLHGRSRRFIIKSDGFGLSLHNGICYPGHESPLWYKKNVELAYFIRGDVRYTWDEGKSEQAFRQADVTGGDACAILMDKNDPHVLHALSVESEALTVFYPALLGHETHDFSKSGFSSY